MKHAHGLRRFLAKALVDHGLVSSNVKARAAIDVVFSEVARIAVEGEVVELRGLGTFRRREYPARMRRNPNTGNVGATPPSWRVVFRAGKYLRGRIAT